MKKLCIVIPAYNEERRIAPTLEEYGNYFRERKKEKLLDDFEILVVLNACRDNTIGVVKNAEKNAKEIKHIEFKRGGKGFAITDGFKYALKKDFDLIGYVDADMSTPPESFFDLVKNVDNASAVIANRWDKRSIVKTKQPILRQVMSRVFNFVVRSLFLINTRDTQCGAKLFKREVAENIVPKVGASEWSFDVDLLFYTRRGGYKIKSIPTIWEDKKESKINIKKTPVTMFLSVIRLRLFHSPFRFVVRFYRDVVPARLKIHNLINKL